MPTFARIPELPSSNLGWTEEEDFLTPFNSPLSSRCRVAVPQQEELFIVEGAEDMASLFSVFAKDISQRVETDLKVAMLEKVILELRYTVGELMTQRTIHVPVASLEPEPFVLKHPIIVVVQSDDDQFVATLFDANMNAAGDTQVEAVDNLKEVIVSMYRRFAELGEHRLGPGPRKQFQVLQSFIAPKA